MMNVPTYFMDLKALQDNITKWVTTEWYIQPWFQWKKLQYSPSDNIPGRPNHGPRMSENVLRRSNNVPGRWHTVLRRLNMNVWSQELLKDVIFNCTECAYYSKDKPYFIFMYIKCTYSWLTKVTEHWHVTIKYVDTIVWKNTGPFRRKWGSY